MRAFPNFETKIRGSKLIAEGEIQPTEISAIYRVRIEYAAGAPPDVRVVSPELMPIDGAARVKHTYPGGNLCLYLPNNGEWSGDMSLAHCIIPWISTWLFYYEMWHATGEWLGGGHEPDPVNPIMREARERAYERSRRRN